MSNFERPKHFSVIENLPIEGSNLYNSQKKLVEDLHNKGIKEELVDFEISEIKSTENEDVYKVYVNEKIEIKYPEKETVPKEFNWVYTVLSTKDKIGLSEIEKWNR